MDSKVLLSAKDIPDIVFDHESRVSRLEKSDEDKEKRLNALEAKMDKIILLEWAILVAAVISAVANHIKF